MRKSLGLPQYREDIYSPAGIIDPYPHYARLRELGPVVWLRKQKVYALPRYAECKTVLLDDETFASGSGVSLNLVANRLSRGTTLGSDGEKHAHRRNLVAQGLTPRALRSMRETIEDQAIQVVERALERGRVDGVVDLALALPMAVVPDLVGLPAEGRHNLLRWGAAAFDVQGPINRQALRMVPASIGMLRYARRIVRERAALPGSMSHDLIQGADQGKLSMSECPALMIDYIAPSIDTTLSAIASALRLFSTHLDQWRALQADPSLLPNAVNEVVRIESPLRAYARKATRDIELAGTHLPAGSRVLVIYASANRDEREWDNPADFDINRDATRQIGFGYGTHGCAGQGLARLETQAILGALLQRVDRIEPAGEPTWAINNIIHRYEHLPLQLIPA